LIFDKALFLMPEPSHDHQILQWYMRLIRYSHSAWRCDLESRKYWGYWKWTLNEGS